ncbi:MAG: hypothetical protein P0S94_03195 [Simkaniaceae bacterium]|nr:hypothetical protein [Simkaniaceae bacterium]
MTITTYPIRTLDISQDLQSLTVTANTGQLALSTYLTNFDLPMFEGHLYNWIRADDKGPSSSSHFFDRFSLIAIKPPHMPPSAFQKDRENIHPFAKVIGDFQEMQLISESTAKVALEALKPKEPVKKPPSNYRPRKIPAGVGTRSFR